VSARWSGWLPLAIAALALGASGSWSLALLAGLLITLPFAVGPRFEVDTDRQALSSVIGAGVGYALTSLVYEADPGRLTDGWARLATGALAAAAARATLVAPRGGYGPAAVLGFVGLAFAGKATSASYPACVVGFLVCLPAALAERPPALPSARRALTGAAVLGLALLLGAGTLWGMFTLRSWARGRTRFTTALWQPRTGFSATMDLGALEGLLDSDQRVLRVRGERVDYLRGASLDVYELGTWRRSAPGERETPLQLDADATDATLEIELIGGRRDRLFLPLEAQAASATPSSALRDDLGSVRSASPVGFQRVRLSLGARDSAPISRPRMIDLHVPRRLRRPLYGLVRDWTNGLPGDARPAQLLQAIERRLKTDFEYAREVQRPINTDPVLDFLLRQRRGHCEYFASALALLGRAAGIPTRIVMGYRVSERSPWGHYVVRERNAHAWVEAWIEGGWRTQDATPEAAQPYNQEHEAGYAEASIDALGMRYDQATDWLGERTLLETSVAWLAGCAVLALIVARGLRGRRREALSDDEVLLAFMQPLLAALARRGHARGAHEPLERLAERVPYPDAADVLASYAALRYGGLGDRDALARRASSVTRALRARD
jgi:protein-glutamine gamma-glutamyltransferase